MKRKRSTKAPSLDTLRRRVRELAILVEAYTEYCDAFGQRCGRIERRLARIEAKEFPEAKR